MRTTPHPSLYHRLENRRDVRFVEIHPGDPDDDISCSLFTSNLDEKRSYSALSYFWGDQTKTRPVKCNGTTFDATENLAAAMRQLRSRYQGKVFWIDAICINQKDLHERAQQVQIMCDIYRSAENVIIYLGDESDGLSRAMGLLHILYQKGQEPISRINNPLKIREELPPAYDEVWYRLHDFFNRPWFSRIWVLQEVAVSSGDPDIICGQYSLSWSVVVKVAKFLHETALVHAIAKWSRSSNAIIMQSCKENHTPLLILLRRTRHFVSTDPRDMLFALYGIIHPEERHLLNSPHFRVSYEKPVKDIYRDAMIGYIKHYRSVEVMCNVISHEECTIEGLPSWVPDWGAPEVLRRNGLAYTSVISGYNACGKQAVQTAPAGDPDTLRLAGKSHDIVDWVAEPFEEQDVQLLPHLRRPQILERAWNDVSSRLGNTPQISEAFWRTLIANVDRMRRPVSIDYYPHFLRYWHDSKIHDQRAMRYMAESPNQPPSPSESEMRSLFEQASAEDNTLITVEDFEAFKHYNERLALQFLPCTNSKNGDSQWRNCLLTDFPGLLQNSEVPDTECRHCLLVAIPELMLKSGKMRVEGHSPALAYRETDPFIAEFFRHVRDNDAVFAADAKTSYHTRILDNLPRRAFFITRSGLMGLGPRNTRPGDEVVILTGSGVPFLLRPTRVGNLLLDKTINRRRVVWQYRVVGECYVHGIMGGEAVRNVNWETEYEVFDLV